MSAPAARQAQQPAQTPPQTQPPAPDPRAAPPRAAAQQPERSTQGPIRTGINYVRVDAIVTDRQGNPVLDLKPEEFLITEDNKPQKIESFSVVKIDATTQMDAPLPTQIRTQSDEEREAARPDVRLFVLLLDDYHVRRGNDMSVRKPIIDFIQNQLAPLDMVAIMYPLTPVTDLHFTRDRQGLISAVEHFEGRKFDYTPRNEFEEKYAYYPAATVEKIRNDVTMGALKGAAVRLGGLREGRKSIIFVSEGFTSTLPPQLNDPVAAMPRLGNPARGNPSVQGPGDTVEFFNQADLLSDMREVFDTANRQNTSIYAVDPRGLAAFEYGVNEAVGLQSDLKGLNATLDSLRILADNTDGRAIVNRNDLAVGMKQIIKDASGYYLIGYNSTQAPTDGKFHEIKVRVTRRGVDVRARKGYWAYTVDDAARASAPPTPGAPSAVTAALNAIAEPPRGRAARFWIGTSKGPYGAPRVTFAWEPMAEEAQARGAEGGASRVVLTATAPDGRPVFRGKVPEEGAAPAAPAAIVRHDRLDADASLVRRKRDVRRPARAAAAPHGRREQPRPGHGLRDAGADGSGFREGAGLAEHAAGLQGPHRARAAGDQGQRRRGAARRSQLQPGGAAAGAGRRLQRRRDGARVVGAAAQSRRHVDGGHSDAAGRARPGDAGARAVGAGRRRLRDRAERQDRDRHRPGADRVQGESLTPLFSGLIARRTSRASSSPSPRG